ncbi:branched-chain amino acid transport system II carrier protein [Gleimia sp. 6138-11-ORH1]|uniref:branched-chain amino acid transport system II carrier protein n=1 Tax=Gleimia sp. 6138-11-ORH1 TaxID=2973937 RepID=UPI0021694B3D|nr:branched-chain amino acid transport system II carrier protein [Gleimia sp. 6138-11-ORH1]MCS4485041.1 branched-chain amino acid transport system II carrier protein [Gleimia sp. 6138-11-ORH1]
MSKQKLSMIVVTGLALFAMYFGAGNLIFPVMLGADAGVNLPIAMAGMFITAVIIPILALVALATSENGVSGVTERIGKIPGLLLTVFIFLVTGVLYAIPRVAAVSFEMAAKPIIAQISPQAAESALTVPLYMLVFFGMAVALMLRPGRLTDIIGTWLTPTLLTLLVILIVGILISQPGSTDPAVDKYATAPFETGLLQGYYTMDANGSLLFGALILGVLRSHGYKTKKELMSGVAMVGVIAGIALGTIYLGLAYVGHHTNVVGTADGPQILSSSAVAVFGDFGQVFFGAIVLLACLTTVVGLLTASVTYFNELLPKVPYSQVMGVHLLISYLLANVSLALILKLVLPVNLLLYPIMIVLFIVSLIDVVFSLEFQWAYKLSVLLTGVISLIHASEMFGSRAFATFYENTYGAYVPLGNSPFAWIVPAFIGLLIGAALDQANKKRLLPAGA